MDGDAAVRWKLEPLRPKIEPFDNCVVWDAFIFKAFEHLTETNSEECVVWDETFSFMFHDASLLRKLLGLTDCNVCKYLLVSSANGSFIINSKIKISIIIF